MACHQSRARTRVRGVVAFVALRLSVGGPSLRAVCPGEAVDAVEAVAAKQHYEALCNEIADFFTPDIYSVVTESEDKGELLGKHRQIVRRRVFFKAEPDVLRWGAMLGDVVGNLRAALDHVVYAISVSRDPEEFRDDRSTEFPITDSLDGFNRVRRRGNPPHFEIRGLPPEAQAIVKALQPHYGRDDQDRRKGDPLWLLRELSNIDKHRSLHMTTWTALQVRWDITHLFEGTVIHSQWIRPIGVIESGAVLAEIDMSYTAYGQPSMQTDRGFTFTVSLDEAIADRTRPLPYLLGDLGEYVLGVVESLDQFVIR